MVAMTRRVRFGLLMLGFGAVTWVAGRYSARGTPGGATTSTISFAGTLSGTTGAQTLMFTFKKAGNPVCAPTVSVTPAASGAFHADIPIDACPATLFDGGDVLVDVSVGGTTVATDQAVNPVPYAKYADQVGNGERLPANPIFAWTPITSPTSGVEAFPVEGVQTITFAQAGYYRVTLGSQAIHDIGTTMSSHWAIGGTATRLDPFSLDSAGGITIDRSGDGRQVDSTVLFVQATAAAQTLTLLPSFTVTYSSGNLHEASYGYTVEFLGTP
jgi:hypothetical protein